APKEIDSQWMICFTSATERVCRCQHLFRAKVSQHQEKRAMTPHKGDKHMTNQNEQGRTGTTKTADDLELAITTMLRHLPIPLTITKRDVDRYAWHWLEAQGEGE